MGEVLGPDIAELLGQRERLRAESLDVIELAQRDEHLQESELGAVDEQGVADRSLDPQALVHSLTRDGIIAGKEVAPAEVVEDERLLLLPPELLPGRDCVDREPVGSGDVAMPRRELDRRRERACAIFGARGWRRALDRVGQSRATLREVGMHVPEPPERPGHAQEA